MLEFQTYGDGPEGRAYIAPEHVACVEAVNPELCRVVLTGREVIMVRAAALDVAERITQARDAYLSRRRSVIGIGEAIV